MKGSKKQTMTMRHNLTTQKAKSKVVVEIIHRTQKYLISFCGSLDMQLY
jgi:hypothetical protein